jgi:hypothetical protein
MGRGGTTSIHALALLGLVGLLPPTVCFFITLAVGGPAWLACGLGLLAAF